MSAPITRICARAGTTCLSCLTTVVVWTSWLILSLLLVVQGYVAWVREVRVPQFLLRGIESRLADNAVSVQFGQATLDPEGNILIEDARFKLASFAEPVVTARAIYVRLNPWSLLEGQFDPAQIRATGGNLFIPAMLSSSGRAERLVQDLDAGFSVEHAGTEFSVDYLTCRLGGVSVSAHGLIDAGAAARGRGRHTSALPLSDFTFANYVVLSREFSKAEDRLGVLNHAFVNAVLEPSDRRGAIVRADLRASGLKLEKPLAVDVDNLHVAARLPLLGGPPLMEVASFSASKVRVAGKASATDVGGTIRGMFKVDTLEFSPRRLDVRAASVAALSTQIVSPVVRVAPAAGRTLRVDAEALAYGAPVSVEADVDVDHRSAMASVGGRASAEAIEAALARFGPQLAEGTSFSEPVAVSGSVTLGPGWKFTQASGTVDGRNFSARGVAIDEARGQLFFDGQHLKAQNAFVRVRDDFARGSYEADITGRTFRYLLDGRLRPLDINPWFKGVWWQKLFGDFSFPERPPDASVDVSGHYRRGRNFSVFAYVDAARPVVSGVRADRIRTLLFADPNRFDVMEFTGSIGTGQAQGSIAVATEPAKGLWKGLDVDLVSTIDPTVIAGMFPPGGAQAINTFSFDHPPTLSARGHFDGPAAGGKRHRELDARMRTDSGLRIHGVVFSRASFGLHLSDDAFTLESVDAGFAGGTITGNAEVSGGEGSRRLRFKGALEGASLGQAAAAAESLVAHPGKDSGVALETFAREKAGVRLDISATAEGEPGDLASFTGSGNVQLQGSSLGELSLLGGLSKLLKITSLRFTQALGEFTIAHSRVDFPSVSVIGANSAIQGKGSYAIDRRALDFSARIYPFQESKSVLQILNTLSQPVSFFFEVKLTGSIDKPSWNFAYSPLNLFRSSDSKKDAPPKPSPSPAPAQG